MERGLMFKIKQRKSFNKLSRQLKITCWVLFAKPSWFQILSFLNLFKCSSFFSGVVGETSTGDVTHYWGGKQQQRSLAIKAPCRQSLTIYFIPLKSDSGQFRESSKQKQIMFDDIFHTFVKIWMDLGQCRKQVQLGEKYFSLDTKFNSAPPPP